MKTVLAILVMTTVACTSSTAKEPTTPVKEDAQAVVQNILDAGFRMYVVACLPDPLHGLESVCGVALAPRDPNMTPLSFAVDIAQRLYRGGCLPTPAAGLELECQEITRNLGPVLAPHDAADAVAPTSVIP